MALQGPAGCLNVLINYKSMLLIAASKEIFFQVKFFLAKFKYGFYSSRNH